MFNSEDLLIVRPQGRLIKWNYRISRYPVTVRDFREVVEGQQGTEEEGGRVKMATWREAIHYCNELSRKMGLPASYNEAKGRLIDAKGHRVGDPSAARGFRLPTSDEWLFAAKGLGLGRDFEAWRAIQEPRYWDAYDPTRYETVANLVINPIGLYGMMGHVYEWYSDADAKEGFANKRCGWTYYYENYDRMVYCVEKKIGSDTDVSGFRVVLTGTGEPKRVRSVFDSLWLLPDSQLDGVNRHNVAVPQELPNKDGTVVSKPIGPPQLTLAQLRQTA